MHACAEVSVVRGTNPVAHRIAPSRGFCRLGSPCSAARWPPPASCRRSVGLPASNQSDSWSDRTAPSHRQVGESREDPITAGRRGTLAIPVETDPVGPVSLVPLMYGSWSILAAALGTAIHGDPTSPPGPPRLLVLTRSYGFEHEVVRRPTPEVRSLVEDVLLDWGTQAGFEAVLTRDTSEFEGESLARYAGVLFFTTGDIPLTPPQRATFLAAIEAGMGFVGVHSATDTFYSWPEYGALVGGYFDGHPWHEKVRVRVEGGAHPATRYLDTTFDIVDEIYQFRAPYDRARVSVLLSLDADSIDVTRPDVRRTDRDFALAWTREQGRGRVFYTALGHRPEVWSDPRFSAHLGGGIAWALRMDRPAPTLSAEDERLRTYAREHRGDPALGHAIFRRESGPMCLRCHVVHGEGAPVGPDLSRLARTATREQILEHVLAPSASITRGYAATILELTDGTLLTGRVLEENAERLRVADTNGVVREVALDLVSTRRESPVSLMPEGLARTLTTTEFADLLAWLETLRGP